MPISHDKRRAALRHLQPHIDPQTLDRLDAMNDDQAMNAAVADADAQPSTAEQLERARQSRQGGSGVSAPIADRRIVGFFSRLFGG